MQKLGDGKQEFRVYRAEAPDSGNRNQQRWDRNRGLGSLQVLQFQTRVLVGWALGVRQEPRLSERD